ncbi:MAG: FMN-binding negative transcriptional regulator [Saprospiraceae bacterium]|nr:FMN-binding negative transcriptional regulator [Saprospiraceae bacterium]
MSLFFMYIPAHFSTNDLKQVEAFIIRYPMATLVSNLQDPSDKEKKPSLFATHLPLVLKKQSDEQWRLLGHFARNNPQWQGLEEQEILVIFSEPHAYISPSLYEKTLNVPTWNYVAIHVYGTPRLIPDADASFQLLEQQMQAYEPNYLQQWSTLPDDYKQAMLKGIVCFEMPVERIEAKFKLSQNKSAKEQTSIREHLLNSDDTNVKMTGEMMIKHHED